MTIGQSVSAARAARQDSAGYGFRVSAAVLDGLVMYAIIIVIGWGAGFAVYRTPGDWLLTLDSGVVYENGPPQPAPTSIVILIAASLALYVIATGVLGRTLGMLAFGLRVVSSDGTAATRLRLLGRAVVLLAVVGSLSWFELLAVLVGYSLWMLFNVKRQLPHDQLFDTIVIRRRGPRATWKDVELAETYVGDLEPRQAEALMADLDQVRRRARRDLHTASVPLFALGLLALGAAVVEWDRFGSLFPVSTLFWVFAGPLGLLLTAWWFHRLQHHQGLGTGVGPLVAITILVICATIASGFFSLGGLFTGLGFLAVALTQRSRIVGAAGAAFALVAGIEQPTRAISNGITNNFPDFPARDFFQDHGSSVVFATIALLLLGAAVLTLREERKG